MEKIKLLLFVLSVFFSAMVLAQNVDPQREKPSAGQEVKENNNSDTTVVQGTSDTPGAQEAAADANERNSGQNQPAANAPNSGNGASAEGASNVPAVPQTTTSQSGSPAILAPGNGQQRDGTNNVQRATMNMAGAPAANLGLDKLNTEGTDVELVDRQEYSRDKQSSAARTGQQPSGGNMSEELNNTRRENNSLSDQNLSSKDKNVGQAGSSRKSDGRKSRKNKGKG